MTPVFDPIAIVGQGCILPGALSPEALWNLVQAAEVVLSTPDEHYWQLADEKSLSHTPGKYESNKAWSAIGGYVKEFERVFDAGQYALPRDKIDSLDVLFKWALAAAHQAISGVKGMEGADAQLKKRTGVILGNLSYPSALSTALVGETALKMLVPEEAHTFGNINPLNRFMSGYPAQFIADALGLLGANVALDAACASGLYAIKIACDRLHNRESDCMLAGGVAGSDPLFIHVGFCALQAKSRTGKSRPFHQDADGLIPAEGAAFVALKRLDDAQRDGDEILGVIRGIALNNDGNAGGFLAPSSKGQVACMQNAFAMAGCLPEDISLIECHATGTSVGDSTEFQSILSVFPSHQQIVLSSLKANIGHSITASGVAGLIKVLAAFKHKILPATPNATPVISGIQDNGFRVLAEAEKWQPAHEKYLACVSSFGFGGNNSHLVLERYTPAEANTVALKSAVSTHSSTVTTAVDAIAVQALSVRTHNANTPQEFVYRLFGDGASYVAETHQQTVTLPLKILGAAPIDLQATLGQQLMLLEAVNGVVENLPAIDFSRMGIYVGMNADTEISLHGFKARLQAMLEQAQVDANPLWQSELAQFSSLDLTAGRVVGTMPNFPANRISRMLGASGPGFTLACEELSGIEALKIAVEALRRREIDVAIVAAVDLSRDEIHSNIIRKIFDNSTLKGADAAVVLVITREQDAVNPLACLTLECVKDVGGVEAVAVFSAPFERSATYHAFGHAHAASGLLHVAQAITMLQTKAHPGDGTLKPVPSLSLHNGGSIRVHAQSAFGATRIVTVSPAQSSVSSPMPATPAIERPVMLTYAANTLEELIIAVAQDKQAQHGTVRCALVCYPHTRETERLRALHALQNIPAEKTIVQLANFVFCRAPIHGKIATAFTGSASVYRNMDASLLLAFPELLESLSPAFKRLLLSDFVNLLNAADYKNSSFDQLLLSSCVSQLHAVFLRDILRLQPDMTFGLSSGETNTLFAYGIWSDDKNMFDELHSSGMYINELSGTYDAVRRYWDLAEHEPIDWQSWVIHLPVEQLQLAVADAEHVYITIIYSPEEAVISGDAVACARLIDHLGRERAIRVEQDMAIHCPAVKPFEAIWRKLHTRQCMPNDDVRFYSNYLKGEYSPTPSAVADALTGQAVNAIDFPFIAQKVWDDGARIFIEHGPRNSLQSNFGKIFKHQTFCATAFDQVGVPSLVQAYRASAALWCAGVAVDISRLIETPAPVASSITSMSFALRGKPLSTFSPTVARINAIIPAPRMSIVRSPVAPNNSAPQSISPPPEAPHSMEIQPSVTPVPFSPPTSVSVVPAMQSQLPEDVLASTMAHDLVCFRHHGMTQTHIQFMQVMAEAQQAFLDTMLFAKQKLLAHSAAEFPSIAASAQAHTIPAPMHERRINSVVAAAAPATHFTPIQLVVNKAEPVAHDQRPNVQTVLWDQAQLATLASGKISSVFGPLFAQQDHYVIQCRMPEPPLLLAHRVMHIEGEAGSMGKGTVYTESDVHSDSWYLHNGRMPAGIVIESGQADLLLMSWLGVDFHNKGERAYRLLGCDLTFHGELPKPGDTLKYEIHVDGHARQGNVLLFFFHYDCTMNGKLFIRVRNGQAGFFTPQELTESRGVMWQPEEGHWQQHSPIPEPKIKHIKSAFSEADIRAFCEGNVEECFGPEYSLTQTHTRTPTYAKPALNFLKSIPVLDRVGGPQGRGYLRVECPVNPDEWFFKGHFKNDPCMPGTLMAEGCLQMMAFYLTALGHTITRDGWRFEPIQDTEFTFICRGQVTPESTLLTYELFVDEIIEAPYPTIWGHTLCVVDGLKAFLTKRFGVRLVPDFPMTSKPELLAFDQQDQRPLARIGNFPLDYTSLINCALGSPKDAFGEGFPFVDYLRPPRLPGPPYHFMTRIAQLHGAFGVLEKGARVEALYDIPEDAWYFDDNGHATVPLCVLMEVALQPCGWLATYVGSTFDSKEELLFRNLDGTACQYRDITPADKTIATQVELISIAKVGTTTIERFSVKCLIEGEEVYAMETAFGYFPVEAMATQKGIAVTAEEKDTMARPNNTHIDLKTPEQRHRFVGTAKLAAQHSKLLMIDRISGIWPQGGVKGGDCYRAEKEVDATEWFFKAHFYQDPVQPGSLGIEAMLQLLQFCMLDKHYDQSLKNPRFEPVTLGNDIEWHYRGQVVPSNKLIVIDADIHEVIVEPGRVTIFAEARLWVDGMKIYHAPKIGMRLVEQ